MTTPPEPPRQSDIWELSSSFQPKVLQLLAAMKARGYDPMVFESVRTKERQRWLYGVGRTHSLNRKPVTWTLKSNHFSGNAVDIISKSKLWNHPKFFAALRSEANKLGLKVLDVEQCHVEMR
jgi:hypothetical protein